MEKSSADKSIMDMLVFEEALNEFKDPAVGDNSQIIYNCEHQFLIKIQEKP